MTPAQLATLATHIRANTAPEVVAALAARNDDAIAAWYNTPTGTNAWCAACPREELFDLMNITQFDGLTQGKRDVWMLLMDEAERKGGLDMRRVKFRAAVLDVWNATTANLILAGCLTPLLRVAQLFATSVAQSGTVSATVAEYNMPVSPGEVSTALNQF